MSMKTALKLFFIKSVIPISTVLLLFGIFKSACVTNGEVDYVLIWIVCGIPFGLYKMYFWITPHTSSVSGFISQCTAILLLGGVSGGFFLAWRLIKSRNSFCKLLSVMLRLPRIYPSITLSVIL